ncbi:type II toxin-antitoxin system HicA family toxin [Acidisoma silvae]
MQVRTGGKHQIWFSPMTGVNFSVPNPIKGRHTANEILKQAGLPKNF